MEKWFTIFIVMAGVGISIYAINSYIGILNQEQQARNEEQQNKNEAQQLANQEYINETINAKFAETFERQNYFSNKSAARMNAILGEIRNTSNQSVTNQEQFFLPWMNETFQKLFTALDIKDKGSNFSIN